MESDTTIAPLNTAAPAGKPKISGTRLTDKMVKELPVPVTGNRITYCADMAGFGCRVTAFGGRAFVLNYRAAGRERRITIGDFPAWTVTQARKKAEELRRDVDSGGDPMARREGIRTAPTINTLADRFEAECVGDF